MTSLIALASLTISPALASADVTPKMRLVSTVVVDDTVEHKIRVKNRGSSAATDVELIVQLPETATSPTVTVMGDLGAYSGRCAQSGTTLVCDLGTIDPSKGRTIKFDFASPWTEAGFQDIVATVSASNDTNVANNEAIASITATYIDTPISGPAGVTNRHCTGIGLTAFFECEQVPGSLMEHTATLNADGSISFPTTVPPGYTGAWSQASDDALSFTYSNSGAVVLEFEGNGVGGDCFEGLSTFPGSSYVAPYEVCLD